MSVLDDKITRFEVALEILGQSKSPFVNEIWRERKKENPNHLKIRFLQERKSAIDNLMDDLMPDDLELIAEIFGENTKQLYRG